MEITLEDIYAYSAGYLDGDGCFYLGKFFQGKNRITVYEYSIQVLSVKPDVLEFFKKNLGGAIRKKEKRALHRVPYCWTLKGFDALVVAQLLQPYLVDKFKSCQFFIKFADTIRPNKGIKVSDEIIDKRENIIKEIRRERHMEGFVTKEELNSIKASIERINPMPRDYAYLAGLIDSEGCFRIKHWKPKNRPNQVYNISLEIGNTKLAIIPWLLERFGGNVSYVPARPKKKAVAIWCLSSKSLSEILPKIYPFLQNKKDVCEKLIEFHETILPNGGDRHSELFNALFEKKRRIRDSIIEEVHKLNATGG